MKWNFFIQFNCRHFDKRQISAAV